MQIFPLAFMYEPFLVYPLPSTEEIQFGELSIVEIGLPA